MALKGVISGKVKKPRRTMFYGVHGIGKGTFASKADKPIFIQTEEGTNDLDVDRFPLCMKADWVDKIIGRLLNDEHDYKTLVIDSADALEALFEVEVCEEMNVSTVDDIEWGKGHGYVYSKWNTLLADLDLLQQQRGMGIILLAHTRITEFNDPSSDSYHRYTNNLHINKAGIGAGSLVQEWCDEVLFANYKKYTRSSDSKTGSVTKGIGEGERVILTETRPWHDAKNRLGLPYELPMDIEQGYQVLMPYINKGVSAPGENNE